MNRPKDPIEAQLQARLEEIEDAGGITGDAGLSLAWDFARECAALRRLCAIVLGAETVADYPHHGSGPDHYTFDLSPGEAALLKAAAEGKEVT